MAYSLTVWACWLVENRQSLLSAGHHDLRAEYRDGHLGTQGPPVWVNAAGHLQMCVSVRRLRAHIDPPGPTSNPGPVGHLNCPPLGIALGGAAHPVVTDERSG